MEPPKKETYEEILDRAKRLNLDSVRQLGVISLPELRGVDGRAVVVLTPGVLDIKKLQDRDFVDRLKCLLLLSLDGVSKEEFNVVLFTTKMKWSLKLFKFLFSEIYSILPRPYKKNIKALYILHAPDAAKFFLRMVLIIVSRKFWRKVRTM